MAPRWNQKLPELYVTAAAAVVISTIATTTFDNNNEMMMKKMMMKKRECDSAAVTFSSLFGFDACDFNS